jgi:cytochrome c
MSMAPNILKIPIGNVEGSHDVYLVFVNPKAEAGTLMIVTGLEFKLNLPEEPKTNTDTGALPKANIGDYVGKYKMEGLPIDYIDLEQKEGKLNLKFGEQGTVMQPTEAPDSFTDGEKVKAFFVRDDSGKVSKIKLEAMGMTFEGKKQ